jgi:CRP-like cAMP-binding protein
LDIEKFLEKTYIFSDLPHLEVETLSKDSSLVKLSRNQILFTEGEIAKDFFIICHGKVSVYKLSHNGVEQVLHILSNGELIAEAAIFDEMTYPASCRGLEDVTLIRVPRDAFLDLVTRNPQNALRVMSAYSKKLKEFVKMIEYLSLNSITQRLAIYLIKNASRTGESYACQLHITKRKLASLLGTVPETLSRTLKQLKKENIISEENKIITIIDIETLRSKLT